MAARHKRVQQKGRFTITEIVPGSPNSSHVSSSTFLEEEVTIAVDSASGSYTRVATIPSQPLPHSQIHSIECNDAMKLVSNGTEELTEISQKPSAEAALVSIGASLMLAPKVRHTLIRLY